MSALDAARLRKRTRNRIVLAREAANNHIDRRNAPLSGFDLVHDSIDVLIDDGILAKVGCIAARCELAPLRSRRLPVVCPDGLERARCWQLPFRMLGILIAVQTQPEPADPRKKLGYLDLAVHVSPIAAVDTVTNQY